MKQKDIAIIAVVAILSGIVSFVVSGKLFVTPENRQQEVEKVDKISAEFQLPDSRYFNEQSINPTVNTEIGASTNQDPFNGASQ